MSTMRAWIPRLAAASILLTAGVAVAKKYTGQKDFNNAGIKISAVEDEPFDHDGDKLWVKLKVVNTTDKYVLVDRNMIEVKTADGKTFKRIVPVGGKGEAYVLAPGKDDNVPMEFASPKDQAVVVVLKGFYGLDLKPITLPNYVVTLGK